MEPKQNLVPPTSQPVLNVNIFYNEDPRIIIPADDEALGEPIQDTINNSTEETVSGIGAVQIESVDVDGIIDVPEGGNAGNRVGNEKLKNKGPDFFDQPKSWSVVKHKIVDHYLKAWIPIWCQQRYCSRIVYIDGFAGIGRYEDGTEGSPLIALKVAAQHTLQMNFRRPLHMIFIEADSKKAHQLRTNLDEFKGKLESEGYRFGYISYEVILGEFAPEMEKVLLRYQAGGAMLVFVDPFGFTGSATPMDLMQKLVARRATDVFINVMDGFANRFFTLDSRAKAINELLGTDSWKEAVLQPHLDPTGRRDVFMQIYVDQLKKPLVGESFYTLKFGMRDKQNRHIYHLLFVTKHMKSLTEMKAAMWPQTQGSDRLQYSDWANKTHIFEAYGSIVDQKERREFIAAKIEPIILETFAGEEISGQQIENFVLAETLYFFNVKEELKRRLRPYFLDRGTSLKTAIHKIMFKFPDLDPKNHG